MVLAQRLQASQRGGAGGRGGGRGGGGDGGGTIGDDGWQTGPGTTGAGAVASGVFIK